MDIRKFAVVPTGRLHLRDAAEELMFTDDGKPIAVNVFGPGSKQYARAQAAQQNRLVDMLRRKGKSNQSAEMLLQEKAELLADCTASFENLEYEKLTGHELALAVYSDATIGFIADQVGKFIGEWNNFLEPSARS
jgi:hypothetical protein